MLYVIVQDDVDSIQQMELAKNARNIERRNGLRISARDDPATTGF